MTNNPSKNGRKTDGTFAPGNKEGKGRPEGCRNGATIVLERMLADDGKAVVLAVIEKAKGGDTQAAKLILDRLIPLRKGRPVEIDLPDMVGPSDVVSALSATLRAVSEGHLTPDEAQALAHILEGQRRAIETTELEDRIKTLEERR